MNWIDFFIGLTLMNAMPHFVLGVWKGRMFSGLGFGNRQNIGYSLINLSISLGLFIWKYGVEGLLENGFYIGACFVLLMYFILGPFLYKALRKETPTA